MDAETVANRRHDARERVSMDEKTYDVLQQTIHDLEGANTLLLALTKYNNTSPELTYAIKIVADRLINATDRIGEVL